MGKKPTVSDNLLTINCLSLCIFCPLLYPFVVFVQTGVQGDKCFSQLMSQKILCNLKIFKTPILSLGEKTPELPSLQSIRNSTGFAPCPTHSNFEKTFLFFTQQVKNKHVLIIQEKIQALKYV